MDNSSPRVCLLGGFSVATEDGVVEEGAWRLRKAKALVKLLALAPDRRLHRERLADLLWPDRDAEAAANNLHQALHAARRAIGHRCPAARRRRRRARGRGRRRRLRGRRRARARARARSPPTSARWTSTPASCCPRTATSRGPTRAAPRCSSCTARLCVELAELYGDDAQAVAALQRALVARPAGRARPPRADAPLRGRRAPPAGAGAVPAAAPAARRRAGGRARPRDPQPLPRAARARAGDRRGAATCPSR